MKTIELATEFGFGFSLSGHGAFST